MTTRLLKSRPGPHPRVKAEAKVGLLSEVLGPWAAPAPAAAAVAVVVVVAVAAGQQA